VAIEKARKSDSTADYDDTSPPDISPESNLEVCDAFLFRKLFIGGVQWVALHRDVLNELNVYPIPDGDTGTNMYLTLRGAISGSRNPEDTSIGALLRAISKGALLSARGNSGVILSQLLTGFARHFKNRDFLTVDDFAPAFASAAEKAYRAISDPKEGTILTVARVLAESLTEHPEPGNDLLQWLSLIHHRAQNILKECRDLLPILKEHSIVDAGGQGLVFLYEGMLRAARFESLRRRLTGRNSTGIRSMAALNSLEFGFCLEFVLREHSADQDALREHLNSIGSSLVMADSGEILKIHLHTNDPAGVRDYVSSLGLIEDEKCDDMLLQHRRLFLREQLPKKDEQNPRMEAEAVTALAVIVSGEGLADFFNSAGAYTIDGGATMNPDVKTIVSALDAIPEQSILLIPNNANCILACREAQKLTTKQVEIIPLVDIGISLLYLQQFDPRLTTGDLARQYEERKKHYISIEVCKATRSGVFDGLKVAEGEWIALCSGSVIECRKDILHLLEILARNERVTGKKRLLVIEGVEGISGLEDPLSFIGEEFKINVDFIYGGQRTYPLIFALE